LGFDGAILSLVDKFLEALPHFKRLFESGCSSWAVPSASVDTPTNWTTIATGAWAGTHGIVNTHLPGEPFELYPGNSFPLAVRRSIVVGGDGVSSDRWYLSHEATRSGKGGSAKSSGLEEPATVLLTPLRS